MRGHPARDQGYFDIRKTLGIFYHGIKLNGYLNTVINSNNCCSSRPEKADHFGFASVFPFNFYKGSTR